MVKVSRGIKTGIIANVEEINKKLDEIEKKEQAILTLPVWNRDKWTQNQSRNTNQGHVFLLAELLAAQPDETISSYELFKGNGNPKYRLIRLANLDQLASDAAYMNKFGNYTLLEKKINWNEEWSLEEKADHLMRSKIINNRLMAPKFSQWNADIINNRTKQFVGNMRAIW